MSSPAPATGAAVVSCGQFALNWAGTCVSLPVPSGTNRYNVLPFESTRTLCPTLALPASPIVGVAGADWAEPTWPDLEPELVIEWLTLFPPLPHAARATPTASNTAKPPTTRSRARRNWTGGFSCFVFILPHSCGGQAAGETPCPRRDQTLRSVSSR